jgi:hypothetical protein
MIEQSGLVVGLDNNPTYTLIGGDPLIQPEQPEENHNENEA